MLTQRAPRTTQECPADQPRKLYAAGTGRGTPMCISYQEPGGGNQGQQEESCRLRTRIDRLLQAIDMPRCRVGSSVWEDEDCLLQPQFSQAQQLGQPPFAIAELCGKLVFTTWSPRCLWLQTAVEGGVAWN